MVKTIRRSEYRNHNDESKSHKAAHVVSAFASSMEICFGQVKTEDKSNEITAIPELLELLELKGLIVTIDAMGCQKKIAEKTGGNGKKGAFLPIFQNGYHHRQQRQEEGVYTAPEVQRVEKELLQRGIQQCQQRVEKPLIENIPL
jgi:predicted transposase YbfD/YdcC